MLYEAKLSGTEVEILAKLIGQPITSFTADGWAVQLCTQETKFLIAPEEIPTPDDEHPWADVHRPSIQVTDWVMPPEHCKIREISLGALRDVHVISALVSFSPVVECPPEELLPGVIMPASKGYGYVYSKPLHKEPILEHLALNIALIDVDIALQFITESNPDIVLYTNGFFVHVSLRGLPKEVWANEEYMSCRSLRTKEQDA